MNLPLTLIRSAFLALFVMVSPALGDDPPPGPLEDSYQGPNAAFHFSSRVHRNVRPGPAWVLEYLVCNDDTVQGLIFEWDEPVFGTGLYDPLAPRECAYGAKDREEFERSDTARIGFTQGSDTTEAIAYVPHVVISTDQTVQVFLRSLFRWFNGEDPIEPQRFSVEVSTMASANGLRHTITWSPGPVGVAFGIKGLTENESAALRNAAEAVGIKTEVVPLEKLVSAEDISRFPANFSAVTYVKFTSSADGSHSVSLELDGRHLESESPTLIFNNEGRLLWFFAH